jgi:hypothetical protein
MIRRNLAGSDLELLSSLSEAQNKPVPVIGNDSQVSRKIGDALSAGAAPMEYAAGHADTKYQPKHSSCAT